MPSLKLTDFSEYSRQIVEAFLQTIMMVDDRAFFTEKESPAKQTEVFVPGVPSFSQSSDAPGARTDDQTNAEFENTEAELADAEESSVDNAHELDAKKLIEDFAAKKMVCAVIRPRDVEVESLGDKVYPLASSSDIVIFDWVLYGATDGGKVKELITEITRSSADQEKRLRLIVVYTGQPDLSDITDQIWIALQSAGLSNISFKDPYTIEKGPVRIAVYAKGNVSVPLENVELARRVVPVDQIPNKVIAEFTDMTLGLVSNVALAAMATLRSNTHQLLTKFNRMLDPAFLAHRAMLPQPEDANSLLIYLIGAELTAILDGAEVFRVADDFNGNDIIQAWLAMKERAGFQFDARFRPDIQHATLNDVLEVIRKGVADENLRPSLKGFAKHPQKKKLTQRLADDPDSSMTSDYRFAELTLIKSRYRDVEPTLIAGTIVFSSRERGGSVTTSYWVCIQPICNCFRLKETTSFPFLPLSVIDNDGAKFDLVLPGPDKNYIRVKIEYSPTKLVMKRFAPSANHLARVIAHSDTHGYFFRASRGQRYYWVAELRAEHAQKIINQYAATLSRVGVDESEWLRRSG